MLQEKLREETLIKFFFGNEDDFYLAGIKRAYRDLNRTLYVPEKDFSKRLEIKERISNLIKSELTTLISKKFNSFEEFDLYHENLLKRLIEEWPELKIGHCQKWINMTLKYWLLLGENRIPQINKNINFFHIPIDSYVLKGIFGQKHPKPWSKMNNYSEYLQYQIQMREEKSKIPIIEEIIFFNNFKP